MYTLSKRIQCPYCGESIEVIVDTSIFHQAYIEDCAVCCRPIEMDVTVDGEDVAVTSKRDDE